MRVRHENVKIDGESDGKNKDRQRIRARLGAYTEINPQVNTGIRIATGGSHLNPHRDPFAGSLRYHLGLSTPNSDACRIFVDGEEYAWRDGEDVMFDETYVHWVKNETDITRVILFCDVERPLTSRLMTRINRWVSAQLGKATAPQNLDDERVGGINKAYAWSKTFSDRFSGVVKQWKRRNPKLYRIARPVLAVIVLVLLWRWLFG